MQKSKIVLAVLLCILVATVACRMEAGEKHESATVAETPPQAGVEYVTLRELKPTPIEQAEQTVTPTEQPTVVERYSGVEITDDELRDFAAVVYLEAGNQSAEGQQAVAEVILNRMIADNFPDTIHDVLYQGAGTSVPQFSTIGLVDTIEPTQEQYDAINAALYGPSVLPDDVVFFSRAGENSRVWGTIGQHVFCYQYVWGGAAGEG